MAVVCAVSALEMLPLLGTDEVRQQRLGVPERVLEGRRVSQAVPEALDDGSLRRRGVGRRVAQQRHQRGPHAGTREHGVHGQLPQADPELHLLERQAPVLGEAGHVARHEQQGRRFGPGQRERVLPERPAGEVTCRRAELHAEKDRSERERELAEQATETAGVVGIELAQVHGGRHGRCALLLRVDHRLEDRPVGLEHAEGPLPRPDGLEGDASARRRGDPRGVGHMELGHPGQLLEGDAHQRIGVLVLTTVGGDSEGERAGRLEPAVARPLPRAIGGVGKRVDRRHLQRELDPTHPGQVDGQPEEVGTAGQGRESPGEGKGEMELVGGLLLFGEEHHGVLEGEEDAGIDVEGQVEVQRTAASFLGMQVDLPDLTKGVRLDEMPLVVYVKPVIDGVILQVRNVSGDVNGCHSGASLMASHGPLCQ